MNFLCESNDSTLCIGLHIDGRIKTQGKKKYQTAFVKRTDGIEKGLSMMLLWRRLCFSTQICESDVMYRNSRTGRKIVAV